MSLRGRPVEILLVEDNPGDVRLTQEAFREAKVVNNLSVVGDGIEAMAFLRQEGKYSDAPRPDIILLDLNLPKMDGREVLAELKRDPNLTRIPVIALTSSTAHRDILEAYGLHVNCYVTKPIDIQEFIELAASIAGFWLSVAQLAPSVVPTGSTSR